MTTAKERQPEIVKKKIVRFGTLPKGALFSAYLTLYTRTLEGREEPHEHKFYKLNEYKAVTKDELTNVYFSPNDLVLV